MTTVMTGFHPEGETLYGRNFLETFDQFWPSDVRLLCYTEEPPKCGVPRGGLRCVFQCNGFPEFLDRHEKTPAAHGREPVPTWKMGERERGYSFRYDMVKFSRQGFIPEAAAAELPDGEILAWLDADVVTLKEIPKGFVDGILGDADLCYLGRGDKHTELGFWACRLGPVIRRNLLNLWADMLRDGRVLSLKQWHSAHIFDFLRRDLPKSVVQKDLTPGGDGHVWFSSPLAHYTDHLKGNRKILGRSPEAPK